METILERIKQHFETEPLQVLDALVKMFEEADELAQEYIKQRLNLK